MLTAHHQRRYSSQPSATSPALALAVAALAACAPGPGPGTPGTPGPPGAAGERLAGIIESIIDAPPLDGTHWGILVRDRSGRTLYAREADRHFIPASNTKLVVTAVALGTLGPGYRYTTPVYAHDVTADSLAGRLVVVASGDPTISARFHETTLEPLDSVAAAIAATGLRAVGELVVDASRFDDDRVSGTWEVGDLPWSYAAPVGAFAIGEGTFAVERVPGDSVGAPARVRALPTDSLQPIVAHAVTDSADARSTVRVDLLDRKDTLFLEARVPLGAAADTTRLAVTDPTIYATRAFARALRANGVRIGVVRVVHDTLEARSLAATPRIELATFESAPLSEIVAAILRPSQNWMAEQLLKTLGAAEGDHGSWDSGIDVEREYLIERAGIDSLGFFLRDASGMSAQNLLTPSATVRLLEHARDAPWGEYYRAALAAPGLRGSTLANRLRALEGRVFAKTGTITNVNSLSGYLVRDQGVELTFSIFTNGTGLRSSAVRPAIDAVVEAIARYGGTL